MEGCKSTWTVSPPGLLLLLCLLGGEVLSERPLPFLAQLNEYAEDRGDSIRESKQLAGIDKEGADENEQTLSFCKGGFLT